MTIHARDNSFGGGRGLVETFFRLVPPSYSLPKAKHKKLIPFKCCCFIDLELYGEAVSMTTDFPEIFGSTQSNGFGY